MKVCFTAWRSSFGAWADTPLSEKVSGSRWSKSFPFISVQVAASSKERLLQHCRWLHASLCGSERDTKIQKGKSGKEHSLTGKKKKQKPTQTCTFWPASVKAEWETYIEKTGREIMTVFSLTILLISIKPFISHVDQTEAIRVSTWLAHCV